MGLRKLLPSLLISFVILLFFPLTLVEAELPPPPNIKVSIGDKGGSAIFKAIEEVDCDSASGKCYQIGWIGQYVSALYQYGVGLAAVLAVVMIMAGGFIWLTAAGNPSQVGKAKEFISSALLGLFLAMFSYVILNALNPRLVNLEPLEVQKIKKEELPASSNDPYAAWRITENDSSCNTAQTCSGCQAIIVTETDYGPPVGKAKEESVLQCSWQNGQCSVRKDLIPSDWTFVSAGPCGKEK